MVEKSSRLSILRTPRARMSLCIQMSVMFHSWAFLGVTSNVQAQEIRQEKAALLQALAYARRAGIDVAAYHQTLKEHPFEAGFEGRTELAKAVHSKLDQMLDQVNRQISQGDPDLVGANRNSILIVDSGDSQTRSHSLLVKQDGTVDYTIDNESAAIGSSSAYKHGGTSGTMFIPRTEVEQLFKLSIGSQLHKIPATALLPNREDGNYLVPQILYVDFNDETSPNLLCASSKQGQQLAECCKSIEATTKINALARIATN